MQNNYKKQLVKFDLAKIQLTSLLMLIAPLIIGVISFFVFNKKDASLKLSYVLITAGSFICLLVVHELFHAFGYILTGGKAKDIKFGIIPKQGMIYCHCGEPMMVKNYIIVLILPIIVTGILPFVVGIIINNYYIVALGVFLISGGAGDVVMLSEVRKLNKTQLILDHPKAPAYYLYYEEDNLPENFVEVTAEDEEKIIEELKQPASLSKNKPNKKKMAVWKFLLLCAVVGVAIGFILNFFI